MSDEVEKKEFRYACGHCGCQHIQGTAWIVLNTGQEADGDPPCDDMWCPNCEEHHGHVCRFALDDPLRKCDFGCVDNVPGPVAVANCHECREGAEALAALPAEA